MKPYLEDADFTLYQGDALEVLRGLPDECVHMCVTSPPYWGLRDYGTGVWDGGDPDCDHVAAPHSSMRPERSRSTSSTFHGSMSTDHSGAAGTPYRDVCGKCGASRVDNQLGLEATPDEYIAGMVAVFREARRVLRSDGTCWVNMGDSYNSPPSGRTRDDYTTTPLNPDAATRKYEAGHGFRKEKELKPKDLCMVPARLALALQADGWWLRSQIVWSKPNPMPESVSDRPTTSHEFVYLLAKSPRYFFDQEAVREPLLSPLHAPGNKAKFGEVQRNDFGTDRMAATWGSESGRNLRSVWEIATQPYPEAHFATYPEELVRRCILAGSSERGCCPECGAPWEREVETTRIPTQATNNPTSERDGVYLRPHGNRSRLESETSGWHPSCACLSPALLAQVADTPEWRPTPCTVLDPFLGSGTTALVARKHGRRTVGIELSAEYCALAARRLSQLSLLADPA